MNDILKEANHGYVGINDTLEVSSGDYVRENAWDAVPPTFWDETIDGPLPTPEQRVALANKMIER